MALLVTPPKEGTEGYGVGGNSEGSICLRCYLDSDSSKNVVRVPAESRV